MEGEIKKPKVTTILIGIVSIFLASAISYYSHQLGHAAANDLYCGTNLTKEISANISTTGCIFSPNCTLSILAGPLMNIMFAIFALGLYIKFPHNHFLGAMALINSSTRISHGFILMLQMFITRYHPTVRNDEFFLINLINFPDMASALVLLFFYVLFNTVIVIITIRTTAWTGIWKWIFILAAVFSQIPLNPFFAGYLSAVLNIIR
jgi:hypothetical protein